VHSRKASFVAIDREILAERYELVDYYQPGRWPDLRRLLPALARCDGVVAWFASWHSFFPITLAWLTRRPSVQIVGGFDTANMPDIGFGYQQGGLRRWASRWIMARATRLVTNSEYSRSEIAANTPFGAERVTVLHHGVPDPFTDADAAAPRERLALNVGAIDAGTLLQKGQLPFVEAARLLPDVRFVLAGKWLDDSVDRLRAIAPPNVELAGWVSDAELHDLYRRASAYVQVSRHEGFGLAVAEAMLAGCVPVVRDVTAMPEVVGEAGVFAASQSPEDVAAAIAAALDRGPDAHLAARARIRDTFPLSIRREGLLDVVGETVDR